MKFDLVSLREAQSLAFKTLVAGSTTPDGTPAIDPVAPVNISAPAVIQQELEYVPAVSTYEFEFGSRAPQNTLNAPAGTIQLNNTRLGENDVFCIYGVQLLIGVGITAADRVYNSFGATAADNAVYNGETTMSFASRTPVERLNNKVYLNADAFGFQPFAGFAFIRPLRVFTGSLSSMEVTLRLPNLTGLVLQPNSVLSYSLHGAIAVA